MKHEIIFLGKTKESFIQQGINEYGSRLEHYTSLVITTLKDPMAKTKSGVDSRKKQGETLLKAVGKGACKVVLDSRGKSLSSEEFAAQIMTWENQGVKNITYLIGGPDGHSEQVRQAADFTLSLSRMVFTHDLVRLLLIEQLYRAYTIKAGERYHR